MKKPDRLLRILGPTPKILLIRLRSLGDTVLMTPVLESLHRARPDATVDVAVEHPYSEVLYGNPFIHRILELKSAKHPAAREDQPTASDSFNKAQAVKHIRRTHYDAVWNLHGGSTSAWLTALSGATYRIGCERFRNRFAYNLLIPDSYDLLGHRAHHTVERTLAWFDWLNGESRTDFSDAPSLKVLVDSKSRETAHQRLKEAGINLQDPYVVVQPAAVFNTKEWMADRFAAVADFLHARNFQVVLTGAPEEFQKLAAVRSAMHNPCAIFGGLGISELVAVIEGCSLFLGNDSGPVHIAAALKRPLVVLFGSSNSVAWRPWNTRAAIVQNPFDCNPCAGYSCWKYSEPECIRSITIEQVKSAIQQIIPERC